MNAGQMNRLLRHLGSRNPGALSGPDRSSSHRWKRKPFPTWFRSFGLGILIPLTALSCTTPGGPEAVREPLHRPAAVRTTSTSVEVNMVPDREVVTDVVNAPADQAWAALQTAYEDFGIPVKEMNADVLILGNPRFVLSRRLNRTRLSNYLDCGYGPSGNHADTHRIEMQIRTSILAVDGGVRVNTFVGAIARNMDGTSNNQIRCASKFRLEREIAGRVKFYAEGG